MTVLEFAWEGESRKELSSAVYPAPILQRVTRMFRGGPHHHICLEWDRGGGERSSSIVA